MMRAAVLCAALWLAVPAAWAQDVTIRSGEHPAFSRLVLTIPSGSAWSLGRLGDRYALTLPTGLTVRPDGVFDRIPRSRIATLTADGADLLIDMSCGCHASAFLWRPDRLVIDINDGPAPPGSPFEVDLAGAAQAGTPPAQPPAPPAVVLPLVMAVHAPQRVSLLADPFRTRAADLDRLDALGAALREGVARAATAGLLQTDVIAQTGPTAIIPPPRARDTTTAVLPGPDALRPDPAPAARATVPLQDAAAAQLSASAPDQDATMPEVAAIPGAQATAPAATPGLVFSNAIDRARQATEPGSAPGRCLPDSEFDLPAWASGPDFASEVGWGRAALGAGDTPTPDAVEDLARTYLYYGFGREAAVTLSLDGRRSTQREVLLAMAAVIDTAPGDVVDVSALTGQSDCPGPGALWAALAQGSIADAGDTARIAIETAFRALPPALRIHLAPRLARMFIEAGDPSTAESLLSPAIAPGQSASLEAALATAEITLTSAGPQPAMAALSELAETDGRMTPAAVLRLMEIAHANGQPLEANVANLAATMQYELRGRPEATALAASRARAALDVKGFAMALDLIDAVDDPALAGILTGEAALAIAVGADDATLAELAFARLGTDLPGAAGNAVAARLLALGFAERALAIVATPTASDDMAERRYLRAGAALALGRWIEAEAALTGLTGERADDLRSRIRAAQGDFAGAIGVAAAAAGAAGEGTPPDPALAWRAGDWTALAGDDLGDPLLTAASTARLSVPAEAADPAAPPLAARAALLSQAEATRALAADLLNRFDDAALPDLPGG